MIRFLTLAGFFLFACANTASATSAFSRAYGLSCTQCHSVVPSLNSFGRYFQSNGYRLAGNPAHPTAPLSFTVGTQYNTGGAGSKLIVNDVRAQAGGALGRALDYFVDSYLVDSGKPGRLQQAWIQYRSGVLHPESQLEISARAGLLYLPLPTYAEIYRTTLSDYAVFAQSVGENGFTLATSYPGVELAAGHDYDGFQARALLFQGHDPYSPYSTFSTDAMLSLAQRSRTVDLFAYRVDGRRNMHPVRDAFWRQGFAARVHAQRLIWTTLLQTGSDSTPDGIAGPQPSSGGYSELNYMLSPGAILTTRIDGTTGNAGMTRSWTTSLAFRVNPAARLTLEDVIERGRHCATFSLLFGF